MGRRWYNNHHSVSSRRVRALRPTAVSLAVASCFASGVVLANPTNPVVVSGTAALQRSGNLLSITNSPNAIINWGSFSIGAQEITRFIQQSQASAVLNRVVGQDPSAILGALQSNGRVLLINPNGIVFGAGSQIDVAGLVASTLNLSDADFLAGRLRFTETLNAGSLVNQGSLNTGSGGSVYLVAPDITNSGIITSPRGEVILAAGRSVELVDPGTPNLRVEINAPDTQARNLGQIVADAGRIGIYAGLINHAGVIQANSAVVGERGEIVLKATQNVTLEAGSLTAANGPEGGRVTIRSGDTTLVSGTVEAKGTQGQGGTVQLLGNLVGLTGSASVDASGEAGGGTVLVGGDYQGKNLALQNAYRTYFGPEASIKADAITTGDGGKVIVWGDDATRAYGSISARGGSTSGNGGFVEVSGKNWLDFSASVNTLAPYGTAGTLLLDPSDVTLSNAADGFFGGSFGLLSNVFEAATSNLTNISWSTIDAQLLLGNIVITTTGSGGAGNIAVADGHTYTSASNFSLLANNNITVNGAITNSGTGNISMHAGWNGASTTTPVVTSGTGNITISQNISTFGNLILTAGKDINIVSSVVKSIVNDVTMTSVGGNINVTASTVRADNNDIVSLTANSGTITINNSLVSASDSSASVSLTAANISIVNSNGLNGIRADGAENNISVTLTATNGITVDNSAIDATGGSSNVSVTLNAGSQLNVINNSSITASNGGAGSAISLNAGSITVSNSTVAATGRPVSGDSASVILNATNGISLNSGAITAAGGNAGVGNGGAASLSLIGGTGVALSGTSTVTATGGAPGSGGVQGIATASISATQGAITSTGGLLNVDSTTAGSTLTLTARDGIGTVTNPIRINNDSPDFDFTNTGATGDIAISVATGNLLIDDLSDVLNNSAAGVYYAKSESGNITLATAFTPSGAPLLAGQSVVLSAPLGNVVVDTGGAVTSGASLRVDAVNISQPSGGSITALLDATASGSITLQQASGYSLGLLQAGTSITVNSTAGAISDGNGGLNNILAPTANLTGTSGIASVASPLQTQVSNLTVSAGSGEIGITNTGNLSLGIGSFGGTNAKIQSSGQLSLGTSVNVVGSISLAGSGITLGQPLTTAGNLQLDAGGGGLSITGVNVGGTNVALIGNNIDIGNSATTSPTAVSASNAVTIIAAGNLTVQGGSGTGASAAVDSVAGNTIVTTGSNVLVRGGSGPGAYGSLTGGPDLFMTVGGNVRMDTGTGAGAYGQIASTSPNSIQLLFPNLGVGGYFVNGVEYTVYEALSTSGFLAGGVAAILGDNLLITYGLSAPTSLLPPIIQTTNTLMDGLLQTTGTLVTTVLQTSGELFAAGGEVLTGGEYIGVWGIVDNVRKELACR